MNPVAQLSDIHGKVTQSGLIVVRDNDTAKTATDLTGYRIFFGPEECDEKSAAPMALLKKTGIPLPSSIETAPACSTAAAKLIELPPDERAAAVI